MEGKLVRPGEILSPYFDRIHFQLVSDQVHGPFNYVSSLRPSRAAIRIRGHFVCKNTSNVHLNRGNLVRAREHQARQRRNRRRQ